MKRQRPAPRGAGECGLSSGLGSGAEGSESRGWCWSAMRGGQVGGDPPAPSTDGLRRSRGRGDGWPRRLAWEPARRLRQPEGAGVRWGPLLGRPRPPGRGAGGSGRAESFSGWGGSWLSSHPFSCPPSRRDSGLWCPGTLRLGWRPGMPVPSGPRRAPPPTSFYKRSKLLPNPH